VGPEQYVDLIFLGSDTGVAVLTGYPSEVCDDGTFCTNLMGNDDRGRRRDELNRAARSQRVIQHCQVSPNENWPKQSEMMRRISEEYGNWGWKCYPAWGPDGKGYWLDDDAVTGPMYDVMRSLASRMQKAGCGLGRPIVCAHKGVTLPGLGFDEVTADPRDVGPAAAKHPDLTFIVYHSGYQVAHVEGPYDAETPNPISVDRLVRTVERHKLCGKNVYADLGVAWALGMLDPIGAQHMIGKLLKYLGEDRVLYGSECLWFGSPQPQIEALRALEISEEFQEKYGYPALTPRIKAKILGLSAAGVYGLDPNAIRCQIDSSELAQQKRLLDAELGGRRWAFAEPRGPRNRREFLDLLRWRKFQNVPA
jgi:predicted TIM-barrel fold metal-dependent hydrolase